MTPHGLETNVFAMYIDNGLGSGFTTTSGFTEQTPGKKSVAAAIASVFGSNRSDLTFPTGFAPQYGLGISASTSGDDPTTLLTKLANGGAFTTVTSPALTDNGDNTYKISITPAQLGLSGASFSFNFMGTLTSSDGYRSNEAIGMNVGGALAGGANIGYSPYTDTTATLVFSGGVLAVNLNRFNGAVKNNSVNLSWSTKSESNLFQFQVLKSIDGTQWNAIGNVDAKNITTGSQYSFVDNSSTAENYYRLKIINKDGGFTISSIMKISKTGGHSIRLLGNPVKGSINLNISDDNAGIYNLSLYDVSGKVLAKQTRNHQPGTETVTMNLPSSIQGLYILKVYFGTTSQSFKVSIP